MGKDSIYKGDFAVVDCTCDILDKKRSVVNYTMLMLNRTNQMFEYKNLPETIPQEMLEAYLQINGQVGITKVKGDLYALPGGLGGPPDPYYRPTLYILANPGLGYSASLRILNYLKPYGKYDYQGDCVLMKNDMTMAGLLYLFTRYATELAENDVSIRSAQINARQQAIIAGDTDKEIASANAYIESLIAGKLAAVAEQPFLDGIKVHNAGVGSANVIIQLIELQQYIKASWYNEIGLNSNFNMKREYLSEEEIASSTDMLLPLIDNMLYCRQQAIEAVNKFYGTDISVDKNSAWADKAKELESMMQSQNNTDGGDNSEQQ